MARMQDHGEQNKEKSLILLEVQNDLFSEEERISPLMLDIKEAACSTIKENVKYSDHAIFEDDDEVISSSLWTDDKMQDIKDYEEFSDLSDNFEERLNISTNQNTEPKNIDNLNNKTFPLTEFEDNRNEYTINKEIHSIFNNEKLPCNDESRDIRPKYDTNQNNDELESDFTLRSWSMGEAEEEEYFRDKEFNILPITNTGQQNERDSLYYSLDDVDEIEYFTEEILLQSAIREVSIFDKSPLTKSLLSPIKEESFDHTNDQIDNMVPEIAQDFTIRQEEHSDNTNSDDSMEANKGSTESLDTYLESECMEYADKQFNGKGICPESSPVEMSNKITDSILDEDSITANENSISSLLSRHIDSDPKQLKEYSFVDCESSYLECQEDFITTNEELVDKLDDAMDSDVVCYLPKIDVKAVLVSFAVFWMIYYYLYTRFPSADQFPDSRCLDILPDVPPKIQPENDINNCAEKWSLDLKMISGKHNILWYDTKPHIHLKKTTLYLRNGWQNVFQADDTNHQIISENELGKSIDKELSKLGSVYFNAGHIKHQNVLVVASAMDSCGIIREKEIILFCMEERREKTRTDFKVWMSWLFAFLVYTLLTDRTYINKMVCLALCHLQCYFP